MSRQTLLGSWLPAIFFAVKIAAQTPFLEPLGAAEGLSQGMIFDLIQDREGFLWFATKDGLNRYDGYTFQVFQNNPFDPFSISDSEVQVLFEDRQGRIWAGTATNGLNILDPKTGKFHHINNLASQNISALAECSDGSFWVGTNKGVNRVRLPEVLPDHQASLDALAQVDTFLWDEGSPKPPNNRIVDLNGGEPGKLWVSTFRQIGYLDLASGRFKKVWDVPVSPNQNSISTFFRKAPDGSMWAGQPEQLIHLGSNPVRILKFPEKSAYPQTDIVFDAAGNAFVSTRKQIFKISAAGLASSGPGQFSLFYRFPDKGIRGSTRMLIDKTGLLWVGTNGYGLYKHNPGNPQFQHLLPERSPRRILCDGQGNVWAWLSGGLFLHATGAGQTPLEPLFDNDEASQHDVVHSNDGRYFWMLGEKRLGERGDGILFQLDAKSRRETARFQCPASVGVFSRLYQDSEGMLWCTGNMSTLMRFNPDTKRFDRFDFDNVTGFRDVVLCLTMDPNKRLWLGTPHGLLEAWMENGRMDFRLHKSDPENSQSLNNNYILSLLDDPAQPERYCWLGTRGGGLNKFDKKTGVVQHFTTTEGLPNNVVYGILSDERGKLWLSTNRGLSCFSPDTKSFQSFFGVDGLQDNEFNTLCYAAAPDGCLFFGGVNGITAFYPAQLNASHTSPQVRITQIMVNGQSLMAGPAAYSLNHAGKFTLEYGQNHLTLSFAAMDFAAPRMNQFRYRMYGADQHWIEGSTAHQATYANLPPGEYVFEVFTGGSRGVWNGTPARIEFRILPPWWKTGWAYAVYLLILGCGIWMLYLSQMNKLLLENKLRFEQNEAARLVELDTLKTNFFSNMTHEFRTPLTLLLEPARQLLAEAKDRSTRYRLELIERNALRLLDFTNQLLDLSKLEAGQMPLDLHQGNPAEALQKVVERFQPLAVQRKIALVFRRGNVPEHAFFDEGKWDQVASNLLSNALKFTDEGGSVVLCIGAEVNPARSECIFNLRVTDSGSGISPENLPRVFERFFQAQHRRGGSGLGLFLTKEIVERMGGSISVQSPVADGRGASFEVKLPCKKSDAAAARAAKHANPKTSFTRHKVVGALPAQHEAPLLLLIEDHAELRQFLRESLPAHYRIAEAANGAEGVEMALELVPDLVVSDLMMPEKNGFEVVEALKANLNTSHIPFILLTAKSGLDSKMQGLQQGADVYLSKPFRADELIAHIESLLASRQRLRAYFSRPETRESVSETAAAALPPQEHAFVQRLIAVIEENLQDAEMDADTTAKRMFISRSQLHRKISALTGLSLTEFVRNYRLDRAKELLEQQVESVAEVAWLTGFANVKYFSTCFRERFGEPPSSFVRK